MQKQKNKILISLLIIILIAIIYVSLRIFNTLKDNSKLEKEISEVKDEVIINEDNEVESEKVEEKISEEEKLELNFEKLKKINNDTVAWIRVINTNIDYPIVQTTNNTYYLDHSFYKEKNQNGWIYESSNNSSSFDDANTVLFGHNTNGKTMFSELKDIYNGNYGKNINISIFLENTTYTYKVFSIYLENPNNTTALSKYTNKDILNDYIIKSNVNFGIDVNENDKILTFSTCNNMTDDRIIMHAKKIS